ncbi:hypothetical protein MBLNU457_1488t1 [Dothideomycetes sp. NU457]
MSRKRSAREAFTDSRDAAKSSSPASKSQATTSSKPVSAFAAARAASSKSATTEIAAQLEFSEDDKLRQDAENLVQSLNLPGVINGGYVTSGTVIETGDEADHAYSSEEEIVEQADALIELHQKRQLSNFRRATVVTNSHHISIELDIDESAVVLGIYDLELRSGTVVVNGALLRPSEDRHRVFAPATHALPKIEAKSGAAEITIHTVSEHPLQKLEALSPLWSKTWHDDPGQKTPLSFCLLRSSFDDPLRRPLVALELEAESQKAINKIMSHKPASSGSPSSVMVTGSKGSGKSTLCRALVNTLLTAPQPWTKSSCFWLDLDPGQPEFGPAGQVSLVQIREPLLGPSFTHVLTHPATGSRCIRAHSLAAISSKEDSEHFLACAKDLLQHYNMQRKDFPMSPLIINCSGWVAGSALSVLVELIKEAVPTDLILTAPLDASSTLTLQTTITPKTTLHTLPTRARIPQARTSAELRAMQTMSYMHSLAPVQNKPTWTAQPLTILQPWRVSFTGSKPGISAILSYHDTVDPSTLSLVLPGTVVAIVAVTSDTAFHPPSKQTYLSTKPTTKPSNLTEKLLHSPESLPLLPPQSPSGAPSPLDPKSSETLGQALIRSIDVSNKELLLLSPVSGAVIQRHIVKGDRIVLVRGKFDFPDWAMLEDVHYGNAVTRKVEFGDDEEGESDGDEDEGDAVVRAKSVVERPYVSVRKPEAGIGGSVWRVRHLPRRI